MVRNPCLTNKWNGRIYMCTRPLKAWKVGITDKGKDKLLITSYKVDHLEMFRGNWERCMDEFKSKKAFKVVDEFIEIGCGKCPECKLQYSKQWALRCMIELMEHDPEQCWFLTLTYDQEHVNRVYFDDSIELFTLNKGDLQKFWKRLRIDLERNKKVRNYTGNCRYFACGEYGGSTNRPHYHAIVYSLPLNDLVPWSKSKTGNTLFRSEYLENIWKQGIVTVEPVSWETCAYTARYVLKKANKDTKQYYLDFGMDPEFTAMSRRPGIASDYYEKNKDKIYRFDEVIIDGKKCKPPKYYDGRYEAENPDDYLNIKNKRKECSLRKKEMMLSKTDKDYLDMLQDKEKVLVNKMKLLRRDGIAD